MTDRIIKRALISVSDKTDLLPFAQALAALKIQIVSTGGTRKALTGQVVMDIAAVTGFPEILDGRVKTLDPHVHGGILARRSDPKHMAALSEHNITPIDMIVCNLYPFEATVAKPGAKHEQIIEDIDIGGPTMIRSAAKNFQDVAVVTNPDQYVAIINELKSRKGALSLATRRQLAAAAFARIAEYDRAIATYFQQWLPAAPKPPEPAVAKPPAPPPPADDELFPKTLRLEFTKLIGLRYGENPHQQAAFYIEAGLTHACIATAEPLHGKELSYNNILDLDSAFSMVQVFDETAAVVIKHNNPCGAAIADTQVEAFRRAYAGDPLSAFGGVLAFNRELDAATAQEITEPNRFIEAVIAPAYSAEAFRVLTTRPKWKDNVRILKVEAPERFAPPGTRDLRRVDGGILVQTRDQEADDETSWRIVTKRLPTEQEMENLRFAWKVVKHVKSNAIVFAKDHMVVGVGAGQMSRVDSVQLASRKAGDHSRGAVMASDAFFPFRDNIDTAAKAGITAVVQPGGSVRDKESIQACDELGLAMVFTGMRHFRH